VTTRDQAWAEILRSTNETEAQRALESIMHEYVNRLVRFAYGVVESADAAKDIVQDVFFRVWERRDTIEPTESLRAYLFTAVRRAALDVLRRRAVEARYVDRVMKGEMQPETMTMDEQLDADADIQDVRAAIARLSERRQTVLRLRYEEQLPFAVVAEIMGLSEKAVEHLAARAIKDIRRYLNL
jgi:RNA polymerase sigma-70 factor (ECF subfamily)